MMLMFNLSLPGKSSQGKYDDDTGSTDFRDAEAPILTGAKIFIYGCSLNRTCQITAPFFDPEHSWSAAHLTLYAQQSLREAYPELSLQDIAILFSGVQSFHIANLKKHLDGI